MEDSADKLKGKAKTSILVGIVFLEILLGFFLIKKINHLLLEGKKVKGVADIDNRLIEIDTESELEHVYKPSPNETVNDHPGWLDEGVTYTINSDGLNERFEYEEEKPLGVLQNNNCW